MKAFVFEDVLDLTVINPYVSEENRSELASDSFTHGKRYADTWRSKKFAFPSIDICSMKGNCE